MFCFRFVAFFSTAVVNVVDNKHIALLLLSLSLSLSFSFSSVLTSMPPKRPNAGKKSGKDEFGGAGGSAPTMCVKAAELLSRHFLNEYIIDVRYCSPVANIRAVREVGVEQIKLSIRMHGILPSSSITVIQNQDASAIPPPLSDVLATYCAKEQQAQKPAYMAAHWLVIDGMHRVTALRQMYEAEQVPTPFIKAQVLHSNIPESDIVNIAYAENTKNASHVFISLEDELARVACAVDIMRKANMDASKLKSATAISKYMSQHLAATQSENTLRVYAMLYVNLCSDARRYLAVDANTSKTSEDCKFSKNMMYGTSLHTESEVIQKTVMYRVNQHYVEQSGAEEQTEQAGAGGGRRRGKGSSSSLNSSSSAGAKAACLKRAAGVKRKKGDEDGADDAVEQRRRKNRVTPEKVKEWMETCKAVERELEVFNVMVNQILIDNQIEEWAQESLTHMANTRSCARSGRLDEAITANTHNLDNGGTVCQPLQKALRELQREHVPKYGLTFEMDMKYAEEKEAAEAGARKEKGKKVQLPPAPRKIYMSEAMWASKEVKLKQYEKKKADKKAADDKRTMDEQKEAAEAKKKQQKEDQKIANEAKKQKQAEEKKKKQLKAQEEKKKKKEAAEVAVAEAKKLHQQKEDLFQAQQAERKRRATEREQKAAEAQVRVAQELEAKKKKAKELQSELERQAVADEAKEVQRKAAEEEAARKAEEEADEAEVAQEEEALRSVSAAAVEAQQALLKAQEEERKEEPDDPEEEQAEEDVDADEMDLEDANSPTGGNTLFASGKQEAVTAGLEAHSSAPPPPTEAELLEQKRLARWHFECERDYKLISADVKQWLTDAKTIAQYEGKVDLVFADPPWNVMEKDSKSKSGAIEEVDQLCPDTMSAVAAGIKMLLNKKDGHALITCSPQQFEVWRTELQRYHLYVEKMPLIVVKKKMHNNHRKSGMTSGCMFIVVAHSNSMVQWNYESNKCVEPLHDGGLPYVNLLYNYMSPPNRLLKNHDSLPAVQPTKGRPPMDQYMRVSEKHPSLWRTLFRRYAGPKYNTTTEPNTAAQSIDLTRAASQPTGADGHSVTPGDAAESGGGTGVGVGVGAGAGAGAGAEGGGGGQVGAGGGGDDITSAEDGLTLPSDTSSSTASSMQPPFTGNERVAEAPSRSSSSVPDPFISLPAAGLKLVELFSGTGSGALAALESYAADYDYTGIEKDTECQRLAKWRLKNKYVDMQPIIHKDHAFCTKKRIHRAEDHLAALAEALATSIMQEDDRLGKPMESMYGDFMGLQSQSSTSNVARSLSRTTTVVMPLVDDPVTDPVTGLPHGTGAKGGEDSEMDLSQQPQHTDSSASDSSTTSNRHATLFPTSSQLDFAQHALLSSQTN